MTLLPHSSKDDQQGSPMDAVRNDEFVMDRRTMLAYLALGWTATQLPRSAWAGSNSVLTDDAILQDQRLGPLVTLNGFFPFQVPATVEDWNKRKEQVRRQLLVALGLWPMPTRTPIETVIHGKVERDGYSVERVYFQSFPGLYVTGSLFRPIGGNGPRPAVLCPHGHWSDGRFFDHGEVEVKKEIAAGGEKYEVGGRYPLQARCVQLARMGCVVFHYDMLGYADSVPIPSEIGHGFNKRRPHLESPDRFGLFSAQAELRSLNAMGFQTWNSIRALDFVLALPDIDAARIGVTGASGGGTQSFILTAIDDRVAAAFPAVMVSTKMQGGCTCENASLLRVGTGNIEFAAMCAPRPLGMTAADDWTKEIETLGLPELKKLYAMLGVPDRVQANYFPFPHNYNFVSRAVMYEFFNKHLGLGQATPIVEADYVPLSVAELTVWTEEHPKPATDEDAEVVVLRKFAKDAEVQLAALVPRAESTFAEFQKIVGGAWKAMIGREFPVEATTSLRGGVDQVANHQARRGYFIHQNEFVPFRELMPIRDSGQTVLWVDGSGKNSIQRGSELSPAVAELMRGGLRLFAIDVFAQSRLRSDKAVASKSRAIENGRQAACFTLGYNHSLFAQSVHDILASLSSIRQLVPAEERIHLVGLGGAGPWVACAALLAGEAVGKIVVDTGGFRFAQIIDIEDPSLLPGAVKHGDIPALLGLCAPRPLFVLGEGSVLPDLTRDCYRAANSGNKIVVHSADADPSFAAARWLLT